MNKLKNRFFSKSKPSSTVLLIVLSVYSVLTATTLHYGRLSADSTIFINIAENYVRGNFSNAINGFFGPLLSWLLIPFLYFGSSDIFAINTIDLILGVLTITGIWKLSYRFEITEKIRSIILISLLPIVFTVSLVQPQDFLLLCILVYYLNVVFKSNYSNSIYNGISGGILGAFAYFTKGYAFLFFISHFLLINICHYLKATTKADKKNVLRNAIVGIAFFSIIIAPWVTLISQKYNHITFSTTGKYNFEVLGPETAHDGLEYGVPLFYGGFFEPPNENAIVAWEDPYYIRAKSWSPLESLNSFKHFLKLILKNTFQGLLILESFSSLSIAIIIAYILLSTGQPFNKLLTRGDILYPLLTVILYTGGYVPFHLEPRYIWIVNILLLLMGGYLINVLFQNKFFINNIRRNLLIIFFVLSFMISPLKFIYMESKYNIDRAMHTLSTKLEQYNIQGNIASNREYTASGGEFLAIHSAWHKTYRLTYHLNSRYYGQAKENISDEELGSELKKYDIDYYFVWGKADNTPHFLTAYKEVTNGEFPDLKIYFLREN